MLRGARQRLGSRRHASALGFRLEDCLLESKPRRPSIRDLHVTEMIILRKAQLRHPPSAEDRRNLGIFEHQGLLYVKGRLGNMKLRPTALTPIFLPRQASETAFIILNYHRINVHAGTNTTLANVRMRYWFTQGRRRIQKAVHALCFECRRESMQPCITPPWPQLPLSRVSQTRPFYHTGLDFFGPVYLRRPKEGGSFTIEKYSVAIFTCMTFRCVHLELCPDLSTQSFLDAFQRFVSRREFPARILSDNGLSFLTAREVIKQIRERHAPPKPVKRRNPVRAAVSARLAVRNRAPGSLSASHPRPAIPPSDLTPDEERITDFCHRNNIEWQTITELSPWRGGSYERLIGIVKHSLKRSVGKSKPTEEQDLADVFWQQFQDGVLLELRNRGIDSKRRQLGQNTIQAGDLVLVKEAGLPRTDWRLALVLELLPSADRLERSARIRFGRTHEETNRALEHLYPIGNVPAPADDTMNMYKFVDDLVNDTPPEQPEEITTIEDQRRSTSQPSTITAEQTTAAALDAAVKRRPFEEHYARCSQLDAPRETTDSTTFPSTLLAVAASPSAAVARADRDQENSEPTPASDSGSDHSGSGPLSEKESEAEEKDQLTIISSDSQRDLQPEEERDDNPTAISSNSEPARPAAKEKDDSLREFSSSDAAPPAEDENEYKQTVHESIPPFAGTDLLSAPTGKKTDEDDATFVTMWDSIRLAPAGNGQGPPARHAAAAEERRQRLTAANALRRQPKPQAAAPDAPARTLPLTDSHEEVLAAIADESRWIPAGTSAETVERRRQTQLRAAERWEQLHQPQEVPRIPATSNVPLFEASPLIDWTRMPAYLNIDEIWERTRQFLSFNQDDGGNRLAKIDNETLISHPLKFAQESFFCEGATWQPSVICLGKDEPTCFHISVGATLIIIKNRWSQYKQIASRPDLLDILNALMRLHVRSFGQMILLVCAARLAGDHDRMEAVLKFIDEVLRARDLDYDIACAIQRHVPSMIRGVDAKKHPYPYEDDFEAAAERWCCYCYKAFVFIYERLSGPTFWSPEWLRNADIPKEFKRAIDHIVMKATWTLLKLKERIYKLYILRRLQAAEAGETTFAWTPFKPGRQSRADDWPETLRTILQKWLLLVDDENDFLFCDELRSEKISIIRVPSINREDVLRTVRSIMPGHETERVYFWFGTQYINNGNHDYGALITELCHHFSTFLGRIHQYVVLPPYNRLHPDAWTFDVLSLYLQKEQLMPHARVILHPYDVRLWYNDQKKLAQLGRIPAWSDSHQSANGTINNWSTVEARKLNMRTYHESDLWTWYKKDARAKEPPPSISAKLGPNGRVVATSTEAERSCPPGSSTSTSAAVAGPLQATAAPPPQPSAPAQPSNDDEIAVALLQRGNPFLLKLFEDVARNTAEQMLATFQPRIDDLTHRLEALAAKKRTTATAEDRQQEPRIEK